jgi:UPF0755 protein
MMRRLGLAVGAGLVLIVAGLGVWAVDQTRQTGPLAAEATVRIDRGLGEGAIAERLAEAGVVAHPWLFRLSVYLERAQGALRSGEYRFPAGLPPRGVVGMLVQGKVLVRRLTVPEGLTVRQVAALVERVEDLDGNPGSLPVEGSLLPETYHYTWGDSRADMLTRMSTAMTRTLDELWPTRAPGLPLATPAAALTLASIVEKETGRPDERPRVAAVFLNRLRRGMPLQSDPTVIYAVSEGTGTLQRPLTQTDLAVQSPYNTYVVPGLPPGPIANPGRQALAAVINPAVTGELYFVADGNGGHRFAETLTQHNRNVALWRKARDKAAGER